MSGVKLMFKEDWKKTLPFNRHWFVYLLFKVSILAISLILLWRFIQSGAFV
jgi:hypothetical protein